MSYYVITPMTYGYDSCAEFDSYEEAEAYLQQKKERDPRDPSYITTHP